MVVDTSYKFIPSNQKKGKPLHRDGKILGLGSVIVIVFGWATYDILTTPNITVLKFDDFSWSGIEKLELQREQHCIATIENVEVGDKVKQYQFAEIAEEIGTGKVINNKFGDLICDPKDVKTIKAKIGQISGTSLAETLDLAEIEIKNERNKGNEQPIVLTITLDDTEQVQGRSPEDFEQVETLLQEIISNNSVVRIMGVQGKLQVKLKEIASNYKEVEICTLEGVNACVTSGFQEARQLAKK